MDVRVRVLGGLGFEVDGTVVPDTAWASRRSRQVAALLAVAPACRIAAEHAMDLLWPELDPGAARANLHKAASLARRALGSKDAVVFRSGAVALWPDARLDVDLARFEEAAESALRSGSAAACRDAARLYTGEVLPEERYEDWAAAPRERARRRCAELLRAGGDWAALVELEPTDEGAHRALMADHLESGRLHAAIRQFQRVRTILRRDLGVQPAAETLALYRRAVGTAASGSVRPGLAGREVELVRARAALRRAVEGRPAAVLVTGPPGIGKTRLGEELVDQAAGEGWLVLRAPAREPTATVPYAALAEAIGAALVHRPDLGDALGEPERRLLARIDGSAGPSPGPVHRQSVLHLLLRLLTAAGTANAVLLLDDAHHADDATLEVAHILASAPFPRGALVVATYRDGPPPPVVRMRDALVASGAAVEIALAPLRRPEVDEIVASVRGARPDADQLELIWQLSGGYPFLALELASGTDAADGPAAGALASVASRMRRLPDDTQAALRAAALVADEFTADELAALSGIDADGALEVLAAATAAGLVTRSGPRYRFRHDLVRDELRRGAPAAEVAAAHGAAAGRLAAGDAPAARVAHHLLAAGRPDEALPWLRRAIADAFAVGAQADARALADRGLAVAPHDPDLMAQRATAMDAVGDPAAPAAYAAAMVVAPARLRSALAVRRAKCLVVAGDVPAAFETLAGVGEVEPAERAQLHVARGLALWCAGRLDEAEAAGQAARALAVESGDLRDFVDATMVLAMVAHQRGGWPQRVSLDLLDASLRPDLAVVVTDAHLCVAESYLYGGAPYDEVITFATDLRQRAGSLRAGRAEAFATTLLGEAHLLAGETGTASEHLEHARTLHRNVGVLCGEALTLQRIAEARLAEGDGAAAQRALDEAFVAARGSPVATRHLLDRIHGTAIRSAPDAAAAVAAVDEAAEAVRGPLETCPPCSVNLSIPAAIACAEAGDVERASRYLAAGEAVIGFFFPQGGWRAALDEARAAVARASGDPEGAERLLRQAAEGFERWGQRLDAERCRRRAGEVTPTGKV